MAKITLTDEQLHRLNHLRWRAGEEDITKEQAEKLLSKLPPDDLKLALDRL